MRPQKETRNMTLYGGSTTVNTDVFDPETLTEAVQGVFAQKTAFMGSRMSSLGIVVVSGQMPVGGPDAIGTTITVPYFGTIGEFAANSDGSSTTPVKIKQTTETASVARDSLGFQISRWAQGNAAVNPNVGDPYEESARQIMVAAERAMDARLVTAASASGVYTKDVYSATVPVYLDFDLAIDAKFEGWGDEQDNIGAILIHSQVHKGLLKLKDSTGRNLLLSSQGEGGPLDTFCGLPVVVSDKVALTGSSMGTVTSSGTSPPVLTLAGTPLGAWKLQIDALASGATTITVRFSTDGGNTWSGAISVSDDSVPVSLIDPNTDSTVGVNGATGLTMAFAAGTFNTDNLWTSNALLKAKSYLLKKRSLAFWYSQRHLALETDKDIMAHTDLAAMHLYSAAHRYRRMPGGTRSGVIQLVHNVPGYIG